MDVVTGLMNWFLSDECTKPLLEHV